MKLKSILSKAFKTYVIAVFVLCAAFSCQTTKVADCIDESKLSNNPCTMQYDPVCGCDGNTYSNACVAERNGVTSWTEGECNEE